MTIRRLKDFNEIEQQLLKKVYDLVKNKYKDGQWHEFKGEVRIKDRVFHLRYEFMLDGLFFNIRESETTDTNGKILVPAHINAH